MGKVLKRQISTGWTILVAGVLSLVFIVIGVYPLVYLIVVALLIGGGVRLLSWFFLAGGKLQLKKVLGTLLVIGGIIFLLISFTMETTIDTKMGRVHNIGLLSKQQNCIIIASLIILIGVILSILKKQL